MVTIEVSTGISEAWCAAYFASLSAISFPAIVACPGVQCIVTSKLSIVIVEGETLFVI